MTVPLRSVVRPGADPDVPPPLGGLTRTFVGTAGAVIASSALLAVLGVPRGEVWVVSWVLPLMLLVFWPVDVLTRRLPRLAAGVVLTVVGAVVLAGVAVLVTSAVVGPVSAAVGGGVLGAVSYLAAFVCAERFGRSKPGLLVATVLILVAVVAAGLLGA